MEQLRQELEALRATGPDLKRRVAAIDKLNLASLQRVSEFVREQLETVGKSRGQGAVLNEFVCYRVASANCELLENMAAALKKNLGDDPTAASPSARVMP
jgi:hypothetical protein